MCYKEKRKEEKLLRIVVDFKKCITFATANEKEWFLG